MARRERLLRARLGLPQGLIERAAAEGGGGGNPRIKPTKTARALAPEGDSSSASKARRPSKKSAVPKSPAKARRP
jgi:hypothetical protein